ncbi:hypothetical protein WMY93_008819 [Mugilogobius chulae]|uniref:C2H2-type domain-containing protein n=1 Tax=Mugilogobius chulae TaxID=88201 RepID=A0AAW0PD41_9GOBI
MIIQNVCHCCTPRRLRYVSILILDYDIRNGLLICVRGTDALRSALFTMQPASIQSVGSSVMNPNINLGHLLSTPNLIRCDKCRFTTTDILAFKKHVAQEHTEYYCFYCNRVSLSEAELQAHLQIHTGTSPFKCPHCGQVYMRRMCLIKHIDRLHSKTLPQEPPKIVPHVSVSSASQSLSSAPSVSTQRPVVRVNVPPPSTTGVTLDTNLQRLKSLGSNIANPSHGDGVPSNGLIQRNRALTVSLPEEVSIPAGCMVQVAEVKTVDGTKELRLRFVAQENESVTKNGRTTIPETSKVLMSQMECPNASTQSGMRLINKNHVNKDRPTLVSVNSSKNFSNHKLTEQRSTAKRSSEVINLDAPVPNKISRNFASVREAKIAMQKESNHVNTSATVSSLLANRLTAGSLQPESQLTGISLNGAEQRISCAPGPPSSLESLMMSYAQIMPRIVPNRGSAALLDRSRECAALLLMPLRKDQAVKRPSLNQPVVVLNHPKPCANLKGVLTNTLRNQTTTVTPKCQILKMKLGKVMGKKYEVTGCTLRNLS